MSSNTVESIEAKLADSQYQGFPVVTSADEPLVRIHLLAPCLFLHTRCASFKTRREAMSGICFPGLSQAPDVLQNDGETHSLLSCADGFRDIGRWVHRYNNLAEGHAKVPPQRAGDGQDQVLLQHRGGLSG